MIYAVIKTTYRGTHKWKDCNIKEVEFLKNEHHHEFQITAWIEQRHDNRDIEYIKFQNELDKIIDKAFKSLSENRSCEMLAKEIHNLICELFRFERSIKVQVLEDGHYGALYTGEM